MGNIRPSFIKIRAIRLVEEHGEKFTDDFDHNKKMVEQLKKLIFSKRQKTLYICILENKTTTKL